MKTDLEKWKGMATWPYLPCRGHIWPQQSGDTVIADLLTARSALEKKMWILESIVDLLTDYLFVRIFYWPGWLLLRLVTAGTYPPKQETPHNREWVAFIGFLGIVLPFIIYAIL